VPCSPLPPVPAQPDGQLWLLLPARHQLLPHPRHRRARRHAAAHHSWHPAAHPVQHSAAAAAATAAAALGFLTAGSAAEWDPLHAERRSG
jgi:hypothetical protein